MYAEVEHVLHISAVVLSEHVDVVICFDAKRDVA